LPQKCLSLSGAYPKAAKPQGHTLLPLCKAKGQAASNKKTAPFRRRFYALRAVNPPQKCLSLLGAYPKAAKPQGHTLLPKPPTTKKPPPCGGGFRRLPQKCLSLCPFAASNKKAAGTHTFAFAKAASNKKTAPFRRRFYALRVVNTPYYG
jgi:hypothetical protein